MDIHAKDITSIGIPRGAICASLLGALRVCLAPRLPLQRVL